MSRRTIIMKIMSGDSTIFSRRFRSGANRLYLGYSDISEKIRKEDQEALILDLLYDLYVLEPNLGLTLEKERQSLSAQITLELIVTSAAMHGRWQLRGDPNLYDWVGYRELFSVDMSPEEDRENISKFLQAAAHRFSAEVEAYGPPSWPTCSTCEGRYV